MDVPNWFFIVIILFVVSGSVYTLITKWSDDLHACGVYHNHTNATTCKKTAFGDHPFIQTIFMFLGEVLCLFVLHVQIFHANLKGETLEEGIHFMKPEGKVWMFMLPALCDTTACTIMNVGLNLTYASVWQMLRGSIVIFTAFVSKIALRTTYRAYQWVGIAVLAGGLAVVGLASVLHKSSETASNPTLGAILVIISVFIQSLQVTFEEFIIEKHNVPALLIVGWEGIWGTIFSTSVLSSLLLWNNPPEDIRDGFMMMAHNPQILLAMVTSMFSIMCFNWVGLTITKYGSATQRVVLASCLTVVIWIFGLIARWESFLPLQLPGFLMVSCGIALFKEVLRIPAIFDYGEKEADGDPEETDPLTANKHLNVQSSYKHP